jgi:LmbE family N-acetylglucosaminyl deacetylase
LTYFYKEPNEINKKLDNIFLETTSNLMIIAHPDDESLWGGVHLLKDNYFVVCVTCGVSEERKLEFEEAMKYTDDKYISLNYPDKTNGERNNWIKYYDDIKYDLEGIINYKDWDKIVTHNPDGEYGHIHHMLVSKIVSNNVDKDKLYYFNKYYNNEELKKLKNTDGLSDKDFYDKLSLLTNYSSQKDIINNHLKNIRFEKFISYKDWK